MLALVLALSLGASDAPVQVDLTQMSRSELLLERDRLVLSRPSLTGPVITLSVGAVAMLSGAVFLALGLAGRRGDLGDVLGYFTIGGAAGGLTGVALSAFGGWWLLRGLTRRLDQGEQVGRIDEVLALRPE